MKNVSFILQEKKHTDFLANPISHTIRDVRSTHIGNVCEKCNKPKQSIGQLILLLDPFRTVIFSCCAVAGTLVSHKNFLKNAIPDCLAWGTDLYSLRSSNKNMTTANTRLAVQCESIKIICFLSDWQKMYFWCAAEVC